MIEQVIGWILILQHYFVSLCHNVSVYAKRFASLTASARQNGSGVCKKGDIYQNRHFNGDSKKKQTSARANIKPTWQIPGPTCLPVIGSFLSFNKFGVKRIHEFAEDRHKKYGDIFRERLFSQELVFLGNADLLKEWMLQEGKWPTSTKQEPGTMFVEQFSNLLRGVFFRDGEDWFRLRKLSHATLVRCASDFETEGLFGGCEDWMKREMQSLKETVCKENGVGWLEDFEQKSYETVLGILLTIVYGTSAEKFESSTGTSVELMARYTRELNIDHQKMLEIPARPARWLNLPVWKRYERKLEYNLSTTMEFGRMLRAEVLESPGSTSLRSHGLVYKTAKMNSSPQDVDDVLTDFSVDAKDPVAGTFMFVIQTLGMYPDIQEKIYNEVEQIFPSNEPISYGKIKDLKYTEAYFKEVIRLYPVAAFTSRVCLEDTFIGGYHIPPGTIINYSSYVAHRDPRNFADPLKMWPERWLLGQGSIEIQEFNGAVNESRHTKFCNPSAFAGFGANKRICIGQSVATSFFGMYLANLVRNFKITSKAHPEPTIRTVLYPTNAGPIQLQVRSTQS